MTGDLDGAIDVYHQALSRKPDDPFSSEMLNRALQESLQAINIDDIDGTEPKMSRTSVPFNDTMFSPQSSRGGTSSIPNSSLFLSPDGMSIGDNSTIIRSAANSSRRYGIGGRDSSMATDGSNLSLASGGDIDMSMG